MKNKAKTLLLIAAFAVFISVTFFAYDNLSKHILPQSRTPVNNNEVGVQNENGKLKAPDFVVLDCDGNETRLSDLFGKPIVLNFWASWCPPCKSEMPVFDKVYNEVGEYITFMMVDLVDGQRETIESGKMYIEDQGFAFPVYYDTGNEVAYAYGISSIPSTIFIDKEGYIVTGALGAIDEKTLIKGIDLINED